MSTRLALGLSMAAGELAAGACLAFGLWSAPDRQDLMIVAMVLQLATAGLWIVTSLNHKETNPSDAG